MSFLWPFKSNFIIIAENTAKYYLELITRYDNRFKDCSAVLAAAGVLDAQNYIFSSTPQIDIEDILKLSKKVTSHNEPYVPIRKFISIEKRINQFHRGKTSAADFLLDVNDDDDESSSIEFNDDLFDFIFGLEQIIFKADSPNISYGLIQEACEREYKAIEKGISKAINIYKVGRGMFSMATTTFMESKNLQVIRQKLDIID